jgi:two-component system LytT family response regulator
VTISAVIVEDEPLARRRLRGLLSDRLDVECIGEAASGPEAVALVDRLRPQLLFLDIELPEFDGLEVLRRIRYQPLVVFTTAFDRYAVSAFELAAVDYLLKPFGADRLAKALDRVLAGAESTKSPLGDVGERSAEALRNVQGECLTRFFVRQGGRLTPVLTRDVERLEADDDYVRVFVHGREHLVCITMNDFERRLDTRQFLRVHRAHMINLAFVREITLQEGGRMMIELRSGARVLASRARSRLIRDLSL